MPLSIASWTRCQPTTGAAAEMPASSPISASRLFLSRAYGASLVRPVRGLRGKGLVSEQSGEQAAGGEKLARATLLDDAPLVENNREVRHADRRETLRGDEYRSSRDGGPQVLDQQPLGLGVDRGHRVVQD